VEQEEMAVARQRHFKYLFAAANKHAAIEKLLEAVFSVSPVPRLYNKEQSEMLVVCVHVRM
jgi:ribosome-interacting GTPase 1